MNAVRFPFLRPLVALAAVALTSLAPRAAQAPNDAQISGVARDASTGLPLEGAYVQLEGPALVSQENNRVRIRSAPGGKFKFSVPAGAYDLWSEYTGYQEARIPVMLEAGKSVESDLLLPLALKSAYRVEKVELPRQMIPEVSGVAFTPAGSLVAVNRRGEVWIRSPDGRTWRRFAHGLYEPFGVVADSETKIYVLQRPELTLLRDDNGDGEADAYETINDDWGITGNYHEFSYGLARDRQGNFYGGFGMASTGEFPWTRGKLNTTRVMEAAPGEKIRDPHRSVVPYQGWVFQITPQGKFVPWASGFRQPIGVALSPQDELMISDIGGAWVPTSVMYRVEQGKFYGHPDGLKWHPDYQGKPLTVEAMKSMRTPPAFYLPRGVMGGSPGQPMWDTTQGKFGPFAQQMFVGDVFSLVMRLDPEKVAGAVQGAAFPFLRNQGGLNTGNMRGVFGPDGALYLAQTVRGWTTGIEGIQRIVWTGENPVEIRTLRLGDQGFALTFTEGIEAAALANPKNYRVKRFQYNYHILDGSLPINEVEVPVLEAKPSDDATAVDLKLAELQPGFVYEVQVKGVASRRGLPISNPTGYYTANRLRSGQTQPGPSILKPVSKIAAVGPPDPVAGRQTFLLMCVMCHQPDGRGSPQVGTPNFTLPGGPLQQSFDDLVKRVQDGKGEIMPSFKNSLPLQDIRNVVAYVRETFGGIPAGPRPSTP